MRILWITKTPSAETGGEDIFDAKLTSALRRYHEVDIITLEQVSKPRMLANIALRGLPHHRARYFSRSNLARANRALSQHHDVAFCSWEPLDYVAYLARGPVIPILHNITSESFRSIFEGQPIGQLAATFIRHWERRIYGSKRFERIAVLSQKDADTLREISGRDNIEVIFPGMPPTTPLAPDAAVQKELVLFGSYEWFAKRRDLIAFARDYAAEPNRRPIARDNLLPQEAELMLNPKSIDELDLSAAIRFGVIADRFTAGHKLKTTSYIAANCIVLTFADVSFDFADIPDQDLFIRRISSVSKIEPIIESICALDPASLRQRFLQFQAQCARRFSWDVSARHLVSMGVPPALTQD
jgi:hypothetical protein